MTADVVPVTLEVSDEELLFSFSLDNWDDHVEQVNVLCTCMQWHTHTQTEMHTDTARNAHTQPSVLDPGTHLTTGP